MKSGRLALERQISFLDQLKWQGKSHLHLTGLQLGDMLHEQLPLSSPTKPKKLKIVPSTLRTNSLLKPQQDTTKSSSMTLLSGISYVEDNKSYLPTLTASSPFIQPSSCPTESNIQMQPAGIKFPGKTRSATISTKGCNSPSCRY